MVLGVERGSLVVSGVKIDDLGPDRTGGCEHNAAIAALEHFVVGLFAQQPAPSSATYRTRVRSLFQLFTELEATSGQRNATTSLGSSRVKTQFSQTGSAEISGFAFVPSEVSK